MLASSVSPSPSSRKFSTLKRRLIIPWPREPGWCNSQVVRAPRNVTCGCVFVCVSACAFCFICMSISLTGALVSFALSALFLCLFFYLFDVFFPSCVCTHFTRILNSISAFLCVLCPCICIHFTCALSFLFCLFLCLSDSLPV